MNIHKINDSLSSMVSKLAPNWYMARITIEGKLCLGYGHTEDEAIKDAYRDYKVIISLHTNN